MIQYYALTDPLRNAQIIRGDGRKFYRFSFGTFQWERTTIFQAYITEGTPEYGCYALLSEEAAQKSILEQGRRIQKMLQQAERIAKEAYAYFTCQDDTPYLAHIQAVAEELPDWEEKTAAWLLALPEGGQWPVDRLRREGFSPKICHSVALLSPRPGESYGAYLTAVRQDRIARRVKLAQLSVCIVQMEAKKPTGPQLRCIEQMRQARKYLFGDIPEYIQALDISDIGRPLGHMVPSERVYQNIWPKALGGKKLPHGLSNPVLRQQDGQLYMAFFVYTYSKAQLQQGLIGRPIRWILADIHTGRLLQAYECGAKDFSCAPAQSLYSTENPEPPRDPAFFSQAYGLLDQIRKKHSAGGVVDLQLYEQYLQTILLAVPPAYHRFYRELSNP